MISVYDHWNKEAINRFEGRELDSIVPIKLKPITDAENYETAFACYGNKLSVETELAKAELVKVLEKN